TPARPPRPVGRAQRGLRYDGGDGAARAQPRGAVRRPPRGDVAGPGRRRGGAGRRADRRVGAGGLRAGRRGRPRPRHRWSDDRAEGAHQGLAKDAVVRLGLPHSLDESRSSQVHTTSTARRLAATAAGLAAALVLVACGADDGDTGSDSAKTNEATEVFPVTIEHAFGETVVKEEPARVATWGWGSTEAA